MKGDIPELLAPAGGPPQFNAALAAGADAIYCGFGGTFNARRGAEGFDSVTFGEACKRAHLAGARVYVTVNVAIRDDEMALVLGLVRRAWSLGADAFIIQDWGLLREVRSRWPHIECHVSTQANVHDARAVAWCGTLGAKRVTLSRELSLPEIRRIAEEGVELECFGHGAICFCYSGVCMMSSCAGDRSANRGTCAQPCRLPYDLVDERGEVLSLPDRGRPLCPRDFLSFDDLQALCEAGVGSLKVEGRLKAPDYIYAVIGAYRAQLDDLANGVRTDDDSLAARRRRLKRAFNRDFTNAYLMGTSGDELMSYERSNNRGELVGKVVDSRSYGTVKVRRGGSGGGRERLRTAHVAEVDVLLDQPVEKGDLLEVRPVGDPSQFLTAYAQEDAPAGTTITCRTSRAMESGSLVRVIRSQRAMDEGARAAELAVPRKRAVRVSIVAHIGHPFVVGLATLDGTAFAEASGFVVEAARTRSVSAEDLVEHVGRMGASAFDPVEFDVSLDEGCGMGFSAVHKVRAEACELLEREILAPYATRRIADGLGSVSAYATDAPRTGEPEVCALVNTPAAAQAALDAGCDRVYATVDALGEGTWPSSTVPLLDEVCRERDHGRLDRWVRAGERVAVGNVSELVLAQARGALPEVRGCIPVHNASCLRALQDAGAAGVWLSPELSLAEIERVARASSVPLGIVVYGRTRAMTSEHCVLQVAGRCRNDCAHCYLRTKRLYLRSNEGDFFPVRTDVHGRSRVYASRVTDVVPQVPELLTAGVTWLGVDGTLLSAKEVAAAVRRCVYAIGRPPQREAGAIAGHLFAPVR